MTLPRLLTNRASAHLASRVQSYALVDRARYYPEPDLGALDNAGQPTPTTDYSEIDCAFTDTVSAEAWQELGDPETVQAEVRVRAVEPHKGAHFLLLRRFGQDLATPIKYEVAGIKDRGRFGYVCALKKVTV